MIAKAGRLLFPLKQCDAIAVRMGLEVLPILRAHAVAAGGWPRYHGDPFDRMLVARALVRGWCWCRWTSGSRDIRCGCWGATRRDAASAAL